MQSVLIVKLQPDRTDLDDVELVQSHFLFHRLFIHCGQGFSADITQPVLAFLKSNSGGNRPDLLPEAMQIARETIRAMIEG